MIQLQRTTFKTFVTRLISLARKVWPAIKDIFGSEVYVYASAIAFNAMLSFLPFTILTLSLCREVFDWRPGYQALLQLLSEYLPTGQEFIIRNIRVMIQSRGQTQIISMALLIFTSMGILLPVELALNRVWGVGQNRNFLGNQVVSFLLILACGGLAIGAAAVIVGWHALLAGLAGAWPEALVQALERAGLKVTAFGLATSIFLLIYYALPNHRVKFAQVLPAAVFTGTIWELARHLFNWALPLLRFHKSYGPFAISVTLIVGAYISSLIMLLGANLSAQNLLPTLPRYKTMNGER